MVRKKTLTIWALCIPERRPALPCCSVAPFTEPCVNILVRAIRCVGDRAAVVCVHFLLLSHTRWFENSIICFLTVLGKMVQNVSSQAKIKVSTEPYSLWWTQATLNPFALCSCWKPLVFSDSWSLPPSSKHRAPRSAVITATHTPPHLWPFPSRTSKSPFAMQGKILTS